MKFILIGIALNCFSVFAQKPDRFVFNYDVKTYIVKTDSPFNYKYPFPIVSNASFPGGTKEFFNFLNTNLNYPEVAIHYGLRGRVYANFIVEKDGTINDVKIVRGMVECPECDKEVIRVFESMPNWIPAVNVKNEFKRTYYSVPVTFKVY